MTSKRSTIMVIMFMFSMLSSAIAGEKESAADQGTIFTFWPLVDFRQSPQDDYRNLSVLGPLVKFQRSKDESDTAIRPLFYRTSNRRSETRSTNYLYPIASSEVSPDIATFQFLKLIQNNDYRKDEQGKQEKDAMFFPFYISGRSEKYGPYTSVFPFYGDIYERFWRDEYHYVLFPLYGRTVKKGTTTRNYLYPFFSTTEGERESGFQFWPLYGQAAKEGSYSKHFALWPFFFLEDTGLDTDNPTHKLSILPLYSATDSPQKVSRSYLWPFFGYADDRAKDQHEVDYLWPFWTTVRGSTREMTRVIPFYSVDRSRENVTHWYMWPLLKREELKSPTFSQHRDRILYFLYSDSRERWSKDGAERRRTAFWPLFVYTKDTGGVMSLTIPAPVEPVFERDGIEKNWAPLWRIYQQRWTDTGDSLVSFFWNLYWQEVRGDAVAYEAFPAIQYQGNPQQSDLKLLKGLIRYRNDNGAKTFSLLWLPFGFSWGSAADGSAPVGSRSTR